MNKECACDPECPLFDNCGEIYRNSEPNRFACETMTDEELDVFAKEYLSVMGRVINQYRKKQ